MRRALDCSSLALENSQVSFGDAVRVVDQVDRTDPVPGDRERLNVIGRCANVATRQIPGQYPG
jgi:hypothetical protein